MLLLITVTFRGLLNFNINVITGDLPRILGSWPCKLSPRLKSLFRPNCLPQDLQATMKTPTVREDRRSNQCPGADPARGLRQLSATLVLIWPRAWLFISPPIIQVRKVINSLLNIYRSFY